MKTEPVHVVRVRGNFKQDVDVTFDSPYVQISGRNGTGKTAIINTVELALTGAVSDVAGRGGVRNAKMLEVFRCATSEHQDLFAEVWLSDDTYARWVLKDGKIQWKRPDKPWVSLFTEIEETLFYAKTLAGGFDRAIRWLYENFIDAERLLAVDPPEAEPETVDRFVAFARQYVSVGRVDRLVAIVDAAKNAAAAHKKTADGLAKAAEVLLTHAPSASGRQVLEAQRDDAQAQQAECHAVYEYGHEWMARCVRAHKNAIEREINQNAPDSAQVSLYVTDADFWISLKDADGTDVHRATAPSGAQTVAVVAAIATAASTRRDVQSLLVVPDRWYDAYVLRDLLSLLERANANVFLQVVRGLRGRIRANWNHQDLSPGFD